MLASASLRCTRLTVLRILVLGLALGGPLIAQPTVLLEVPPEIFIGESFHLRVTFTNPGPVGFGPYIDLLLPAAGADGDAAACPCDGLTFLNAQASFPVEVLPATPPVQPTTPGGETCNRPAPPAVHPLTGLPLTVPPGYQLVVLRLPFASFVPGEPAVTIDVEVDVSPSADLGSLVLFATPGFQWGSDSNADPVSQSVLGGTQSATTKLGVFALGIEDPLSSSPGSCFDGVDNGGDGKIDGADPDCTRGKTYLGPEDETATGPNFPQRYEIVANVAAGQTVSHLIVKDPLPPQLRFNQLVGVWLHGVPVGGGANCSTTGVAFVVKSLPSPFGLLEIDLCSVTGTDAPDDVRIVFEFHVPDIDANGQPILDLSTCAPVPIPNDVRAEGLWMPIDPCDLPADPVLVSSDIATPDHVLNAKCVAIQKAVAVATDTGAAGPTPGDTLRYTLSFQVSNYVRVRPVTILDTLSDGQSFLPNPPPVLAPALGGPLTRQVTTKFPSIFSPTAKCGDGTTDLALLVPGPFQGTASTITFHARIDNAFHCSVPGDTLVDKHDPISNKVRIDGREISPVGGVHAIDTSSSTTAIVFARPTKTVFAIRRATDQQLIVAPNPALVSPFDEVTYRFTYPLPSCDTEGLAITDYLPLPVLDVDEPAPAPPWTVTTCAAGTVPPPFQACLGPAHTAPLALSVGSSSSANTLAFGPWTVHGTSNNTCTVDLLYTVKATCDPYGDRLRLTNRALECEHNSIQTGINVCQEAIAEVRYAAPQLRIQKGAVAACCPGSLLEPAKKASGEPLPPFPDRPVLLCNGTGLFAPSKVGPVSFTPPGSKCPRFSGTVSSAGLESAPVNSDLIGDLDPGNLVTFAIVVENVGSGPYGAFGTRIQDNLPIPAGFVKPGTGKDGINLCVQNGAGVPLAFTGGVTSGDDLDLTLTDGQAGGALGPHDATSGQNVAVITYDLEVSKELAVGQCVENTAKIEDFRAAPSMSCPTLPKSGYGGGPFEEKARVCRYPEAQKSIVKTSAAHTVSASPEPLAIGEIVRYQLKVRLPEGSTPFLRLVDTLPPGLTLATFPPPTGNVRVQFQATQPPGFISPDLASAWNATAPVPLPPARLQVSTAGNGQQTVTINLGIVTTQDRDCDDEFVLVELNAQVLNTAANNDGDPKPNSFRAIWGRALPPNTPPSVTSNTVTAKIVEPKIQLTKKATSVPSPLVNGSTVTYQITATNTGTATAFEPRITDSMPPCLRLVPGSWTSTATGGASAPVVLSPNATTLVAQAGLIPVGGSITVTFKAIVICLSCVETTNTVRATWTSLPGANGTVLNSTGSFTNGSPGAFDGERTGATGVNDYTATATAQLAPLCGPDLSMEKHCYVLEGRALGCLLVLTNVGKGAAVPPITVTDMLPQSIPFVPNPQTTSGFACTGNGATPQEKVTCVLGAGPPIPPGASVVLALSLGYDENTLTGFRNCAVVSVANDPAPKNNIDCASLCVPDPDLEYLNQGGAFSGNFDPLLCRNLPNPPCEHDETLFFDECGCACVPLESPDLMLGKIEFDRGPGGVAYRVHVRNIGLVAASGFTVSDSLPDGAALVPGSVHPTPPWSCVQTTTPKNLLTCTYAGTLAPNATAQPLYFLIEGVTTLDPNCATVTAAGDGNARNDRGCTDCPDATAPGVQYQTFDGPYCSILGMSCPQNSWPFFSPCGCGCAPEPSQPGDDTPIVIFSELPFELEGVRALPGGDVCLRSAASGEREIGSVVLDGERDLAVRRDERGTLRVTLPQDLAAGEHRLGLERGVEAPARTFEAIRIEASLDQNELFRGEGTLMRLRAVGTEEPVRVRVTNRTPRILKLDGGNDQVLTTRGGAENVIEARVRGKKRGAFDLQWTVLLEGCGAEPRR